MSFAIGSALLERDVQTERAAIEAERKRLEKAAEDAVKKQQKQGMYGSLYKTIGSIGLGTLGTLIGGSEGGKLGAKIGGGILGSIVGPAFVDTKKEEEALKSQLKAGKFYSGTREDITKGSKDLQKDFKEAEKGMKTKLAFSSIATPLMAYGAAEGLGGFSKEALLAGGDKMSFWDALISQSEFSPFMGDKEKAATTVTTGSGLPYDPVSQQYGPWKVS